MPTTLTITEDPAAFSPWPEQQPFLDDFTVRYCAMAGGWGAGKSRMGSRKHSNLHLYNALDDKDRPTGVPSLIVAPTYQLAQTVNIPQMREALDEMGLSHRFVADPKKFWFELPDLGTRSEPSKIIVRSADAAHLIAGFEVGNVWGDEAARWKWAREGENPLTDAFLQADARLRHPKARFLQFNVTYTNEGEDTRVYTDFEAEPKADHRLHRVSTRANKSLDPAYVQSQLGQLSADLVSQYIDGYAAKLGANLVYYNYDDARNKDDSVELVHGLPLQLAVDFNKTPGMFGTLGQYFPDRDLLTTRHVLHAKGLLIKTMVAQFYFRFGKDFAARRFPVVELFGDVAGRTGNASDGESYWDALCAELTYYKIPFRLRLPTHAPLQVDRANASNSAFQSADGRVRWKIHPDCKELIRDFKHLKWDGRHKIDKQQKELSHASDADTYRCHYLMPIRKIPENTGRVASVPQPA